ncbi:MAG TPA: PqiC family protein [Thermodesulfovibrionales bacterium]|nr:PqiC family protein [Thermodesulfovibrionales bacterium]
MKNILFDHRALLTFGLFLVILTGCGGSPSSKFYQLAPLQNKASVTRDVSSEQSMVVSIGPVRIPDYLDRPQIVTRSGRNELNLAEFNRWAGSLGDDVNRVLVEDVSSLLPADRFFVVRWTPYIESQIPVSCKVELHLERFEGTLGDSMLLRAKWGVFGKENRLLLKKESVISEKMSGGSYDALVASMSNALERLSRDIADGIGSACPTGGADKKIAP